MQNEKFKIAIKKSKSFLRFCSSTMPPHPNPLPHGERGCVFPPLTGGIKGG